MHVKPPAQGLACSTHSIIISYDHSLVIHFLSKYSHFRGVLIIAVLDTVSFCLHVLSLEYSVGPGKVNDGHLFNF